MSVKLRAVVLALVVVGATAAPAAAQEGAESQTSPSYPGNTITAAPDDKGPLVAGTIRSVALSGHAEWNDPNDTTSYAVYLYVQDAAVSPTCEASYDLQLQKNVNLGSRGLNATTGFSGWVLDGGYRIGRTTLGAGTDWATSTPPFEIRRGVEKVVLCAYTQYITDDVAAFGVAYPVVEPGCRTQRSVRRGKALRFVCNFTGKVVVRFTRGSKRVDRSLVLSDANEPQGSGRARGRLSTRGIPRGRHRLQIRAGVFAFGDARRVRIT